MTALSVDLLTIDHSVIHRASALKPRSRMIYSTRSHSWRRRLYLRAGGNGPDVVRDCLAIGLPEIGVSVRVNASAPRASVVVALSGINELEKAISWKKAGLVERVVAGPNVVMLPSDAPGIDWEQVDVNVVPSTWVRDAVLDDIPHLAERVLVWPAGIRFAEWALPSHDRRAKQIVILDKLGPAFPVGEVVTTAENAGFACSVLPYGLFTRTDFRAALSAASCVVALSQSETQGIALLESWASDVPTLCYDSQLMHHRGRPIRSSAAPYMTPKRGSVFRSASEVATALPLFLASLDGLRPRASLTDDLEILGAARAFAEALFPSTRISH